MASVENSKTGILIGIEGIDAAGKRTQSTLLEAWLRSKGIHCRIISFPDYTTVLGMELKNFLAGTRNYSPWVGHMLFAANRWERREDMAKWLSTGEVLIVNRYTESNLAYGMANGLPLDWLRHLEDGLPKTDKVILLDANPSKVVHRRGEGKDKYESDLKLQERVAEFYRQLAEKFGWFVVSGTGDINTIHESIMRALEGLLPKSGQTS
ncbi:MAG: dTMP kinase [Thaumarchaeota archaeon]|nr:dTMP kinase [Nitrososphaerota archaeon]